MYGKWELNPFSESKSKYKQHCNKDTLKRCAKREYYFDEFKAVNNNDNFEFLHSAYLSSHI